MILIFVFLCICRSNQQNTWYNETITIPPRSFMQIASMTVPEQKYIFNPGIKILFDHSKFQGQISSSMVFKYSRYSPNPSVTFNLFVFNKYEESYPCTINELILSADPTVCFGKTNDKTMRSCNDLSFQNSTIKIKDLVENSSMLVTDCSVNETVTSLSLELFDIHLDSDENTQYIFVIQNQSLGGPLLGPVEMSVLLSYGIQIHPSDKFYELTLGLCIALGILVILLTSVLCIFNYKYQKVKEQNITFNLVRGESNQNKKAEQKMK